MIKFRIGVTLVILIGLLLAGCNKHVAQKKEVAQTYYTCPMHKDIIEMRPMKCPKCGMELQTMDIDNYQRHSGNTHGNSQPSTGGGHSGHQH